MTAIWEHDVGEIDPVFAVPFAADGLPCLLVSADDEEKLFVEPLLPDEIQPFFAS